jgi:hypothetical protein
LLLNEIAHIFSAKPMDKEIIALTYVDVRVSGPRSVNTTGRITV